MPSNTIVSRLETWLIQTSDDDYDAAHSQYRSEPYHHHKGWRKFLEQCIDLQEQEVEPVLDRSAHSQDFYNAYRHLDARVTVFPREQERETRRQNMDTEIPPPYSSTTTLNRTYGNPPAYVQAPLDSSLGRFEPHHANRNVSSSHLAVRQVSAAQHRFHDLFHGLRNSRRSEPPDQTANRGHDLANPTTDRRRRRLSGLFNSFARAPTEDYEHDRRDARGRQPDNVASTNVTTRFSRTGFAISSSSYHYNRR